MNKRLACLLSFSAVVVLTPSVVLANDPHCEGKAGYYGYQCSDPASNEVVVFADVKYGGKCMRFSTNAAERYIPSLSDYGFNDCISSVKVGSNVRLLAYQNDNFNVETTGGVTSHDLNWHMATYEPGNTEATVNDDFSSLIIERIDLTNKELIPNNYIGSNPTNNDHAFWEMEAQGLCHTKDYWFIAQEAYLPDDRSSFAHSPNYSCVFSDSNNNFTGKIWRVPLGAALDSSQVPSGAKHNELYNMVGVPSTTMGYRHFGDPDCQTIGGKEYVFVPVQGCKGDNGDNPLPYVLVLDTELNPVASLTVPTVAPSNSRYADLAACLGKSSYSDVMHTGLASWVAVRPSSSTPTSVEVWMSTDICDGLGMQVFTADLTRSGSIEMAFKLPAPVITDECNLPRRFPAVQGGVFSPRGNTLYLSTGDTEHYGGVRVINPDTGQELTQSGNKYGPFSYQQQEGHFCVCYIFGCTCWNIVGQEPEGLDFFDTRCATPGLFATASQLHVVLLHNGAYNSGDQVELKHYSFSDAAAPEMCDGAGGTGGNGGSGGAGGSGSGGSGWDCIKQCSTQTQSDLKMCQNYLSCYVTNNCNPSTCGGQDQVCGVNTLGGGTAPKQIADSAYSCLLQSGGSDPTSVNACLQSWPATTCGQQCTGQTQSDRQTCKAYLDCYYMNGCGPSAPCASQDAVCGVNQLGGGTAGKIIADQVYQCLGCQ